MEEKKIRKKVKKSKTAPLKKGANKKASRRVSDFDNEAYLNKKGTSKKTKVRLKSGRAENVTAKKRTSKKKKKSNAFINALLSLFTVVFLISSLFLGKTLYGYYVAKKEYKQINDSLNIDISKPADYSDMINMLKNINEDCVGYIKIDQTDIAYPIVKGKDNEYYLHHTIKKKYNSSGSIFMDKDNNAYFADDNTIIYGHHMKDGSMFAHLSKFRKKDYMNEHKTVTVIYDGGVCKYEIFAACLYDATDNYRVISFSTESERENFSSLVYSKDVCSIPINIKKDDRILTLSTCAYDSDNARLVVHAVLVSRQTN